LHRRSRSFPWHTFLHSIWSKFVNVFLQESHVDIWYLLWDCFGSISFIYPWNGPRSSYVPLTVSLMYCISIYNLNCVHTNVFASCTYVDWYSAEKHVSKGVIFKIKNFKIDFSLAKERTSLIDIPNFISCSFTWWLLAIPFSIAIFVYDECRKTILRRHKGCKYKLKCCEHTKC
jgi:hypothetical protein